MNKDTVVGLLLIFGIMIGYSIWFAPEPREVPEESKEVVRQHDTPDAREVTPEDTVQEPQSTGQTLPDQEGREGREEVTHRGSFSHASRGENQFYILENDLMRMKISSEGGRVAQVQLKKYETYDSLPVILFTPDSSRFSFQFYNDRDHLVNTGDYYFEPVFYQTAPENHLQAGSGEPLVFGMRLYDYPAEDTEPNGQGYLEFKYTITPGSYMVDVEMVMNNLGRSMRSVYGNNVLDLEWNAQLRQQEKSQRAIMGGGSTIFYRDNLGEVDDLGERDEGYEEISTAVEWIAFKQRFFNVTFWSREKAIESAELRVVTETEDPPPGSRYLRTMETLLAVQYQDPQNHSADFAFYFGPNDYTILRGYELEMEQLIPLGWGFFLLHWINRYAVIPVFNYLEGFDLSYGIIIFILTLLLKIILFPIAYKTYKSSARMRVLKPDVEEIGKKYPKKEDAMKKQQATMALYKKAGVNPLSGCLPMLLQLPILIAMFRFFPSSIELRGESFLWAHDLSSFDSIAQLPFTIPFYGDHVSLFTLLMAISTALYTYMNSQNMNTGQQMPGMKTMMYMMPVMLLFIFNGYASGLSYYYFLANMITFLQMVAIRRFIDEDAIRVKIQANKKKTVKKSKFQQRLEEAANRQQQKRKR